MCERPGFWRWLFQGLVEAIRAVPGTVSRTKRKVLLNIKSPLFEIIIGVIGIVFSLTLSLIILGVTFYTRVVAALLAVPSLLLLLHGFYREEDC